MNEEIGLAIIAVGVLFDLLGCIGMVRFPDVYNRLTGGDEVRDLGRLPDPDRHDCDG